MLSQQLRHPNVETRTFSTVPATEHPRPFRHTASNSRMLHAKQGSILQRPVRISRQRLSAVAKLASRPTETAAPRKAADLSNLKEQSQAYIDRYVVPVAKTRQQVYASQEQVFDKLLSTPDLDKKLARGDQDLQQAAHIVESAVASAIQLAFHGSPSSSSSTKVDSSQASGEFGCIALDSDDQCGVDWDSESLWDNAAAAAGSVGSSGLDFEIDGSLDTPAGSGSDQLSARAAVALDAATGEAAEVASAHTFLQRLLYKINRLNHFWYDDLSNYVNERSLWLAKLRDTIEEPWQEWEMGQLLASPDVAQGVAQGSIEGYRGLSVQTLKEALKQRYDADVDPPLSAAQQYVVNEMDALGYAHLLAVGSVDGLVEASRQSRVCAGAANQVACTIFRVLMEEYGTGRYAKKHSTFYKKGMEELGLNTKEEFYLDLLPWQWLASSNQNFLITERRRHYLRYAGALTFFEINGPSVYKTYLAAGRRNGLSADASGYWELHIKEDERHGRQMLEEVALPLVDMYPKDSWEMLLGYDQDRFMGGRAGAALVKQIQVAAGLKRELEGNSSS